MILHFDSSYWNHIQQNYNGQRKNAKLYMDIKISSSDTYSFKNLNLWKKCLLSGLFNKEKLAAEIEMHLG